MRRIPFIAAAALVLSLAAAPAVIAAPPAPKPTTTTAPPTTTTLPPTTTTVPASEPVQVLGVPHVVTKQAGVVTNQVGQWIPDSLRCPEGEVALSFAWHMLGSDAHLNGFASASVSPPQYRPIVENGQPVGYEWFVNNNSSQAFFVTCAPLVSVQPA